MQPSCKDQDTRTATLLVLRSVCPSVCLFVPCRQHKTAHVGVFTVSSGLLTFARWRTVAARRRSPIRRLPGYLRAYLASRSRRAASSPRRRRPRLPWPGPAATTRRRSATHRGRPGSAVVVRCRSGRTSARWRCASVGSRGATS